MEGILWKWTNYWNGWQTRWFVLQNGCLTYYRSQEEVIKGCKGSLKVQACDIIVHSVDATRLDLDIPGEQHLYLKAATPQERQAWLVALGSAKACVQSRHKKENFECLDSNGESNSDVIKTKKSELRLYCDLLMQQAHIVKTAATNENGPEVQKMNDATSLLSATCDTFIKTLEECMKLCSANILYELPHHNEVTLPPVHRVPATRKISKPIIRMNSSDS